MALDVQATYAEPGVMTDLSRYDDMLAGLPDDVGELCKVVQGVMLHVHWASAYGVTRAEIEPRRDELQIRAVGHMINRIRELDPRPLAMARPPRRRLLGNCRDFATLLVALLRRRGVLARARCGFGTYFTPGKYEDHWVAEIWREDERRWVLVDPQLDEVQVRALKIDFDPLDVPRDRFLTGPVAWQQCRIGGADVESFGIFDMKGLWFVRGNLVRDLAALAKMELLPWDSWGVIDQEDGDKNPQTLALLDHAARLALAGDDLHGELLALYEREAGLRVPAVINSYPAQGVRHTVALAHSLDAEPA